MQPFTQGSFKNTDAQALPLIFDLIDLGYGLRTGIFKAPQVIAISSQNEEPFVSQVLAHHLLKKDFCDITTTSHTLSYPLVFHFSFPSWKLSELTARVFHLFMSLFDCLFPREHFYFALHGNTCKCNCNQHTGSIPKSLVECITLMHQKNPLCES